MRWLVDRNEPRKGARYVSIECGEHGLVNFRLPSVAKQQELISLVAAHARKTDSGAVVFTGSASVFGLWIGTCWDHAAVGLETSDDLRLTQALRYGEFVMEELEDGRPARAPVGGSDPGEAEIAPWDIVDCMAAVAGLRSAFLTFISARSRVKEIQDFGARLGARTTTSNSRSAFTGSEADRPASTNSNKEIATA